MASTVTWAPLPNDVDCWQASVNDGRPRPAPGDYFLTNRYGRSCCRAYTAPPAIRGRLICSITQGTYLGPVNQVEVSAIFVTIEVRGYWINVWAAEGNAHFARKVPQRTVDSWVHRGWHHWY